MWYYAINLKCSGNRASCTISISKVINKLLFIKITHSAIFWFMVTCLFYILYCAITMTYNWTLLVALSAILIEGLALILNRFQCPLTSLARKYGDDKGTVADIFLPAWYARNTFKFAAVLFTMELILLDASYFSS